MPVAIKHQWKNAKVAYCGAAMSNSDDNGQPCQLCKSKLKYSYTYTLQSKGELLEALHKAGIFYNPFSEQHEEAEISWPSVWQTAHKVHGDMEFGAEMPCGFDGNSFYVHIIDDDLVIEDIFRLTTAQAVSRIAAFVAGQYWADVAGIANREVS